MGRDNQPKHRQKKRDLRRREAVRQAYERLLIVCEGEKTEPQYLREICEEERLSTAHVCVLHGGYGTAPLQVVEFAEHVLCHGDKAAGVERGAFDRAFVVFDRDQHESYHQALEKVAALNDKLTNDERRRIPVHAVASVPCFELWLLLHFEDIQAPLHRSEVYARLREHLPTYDKGRPGLWACTKDLLDTAMQRSAARAQATSAYDGSEPYTNMGSLVRTLRTLKTAQAMNVGEVDR